MGMKPAMRCKMVQLDYRTIIKHCRVEIVPSIRSCDRSVQTFGLRLILEQPDVVLILVGVQSNLLLFAASRIHVVMRMQVATLSVVVPDADTAAQCNIDWDILHAFRVQRSLKLRRHESVSIARINETDEVYGKHGHVECHWNDDETERSGQKVLEPEPLQTISIVGNASEAREDVLVSLFSYRPREPTVEQS